MNIKYKTLLAILVVSSGCSAFPGQGNEGKSGTNGTNGKDGVSGEAGLNGEAGSTSDIPDSGTATTPVEADVVIEASDLVEAADSTDAALASDVSDAANTTDVVDAGVADVDAAPVLTVWQTDVEAGISPPVCIPPVASDAGASDASSSCQKGYNCVYSNQNSMYECLIPIAQDQACSNDPTLESQGAGYCSGGLYCGGSPGVCIQAGYSCNPTPEGGVSSLSYPGYTCVQVIN
jgi:hypothetical protein